jgi:hypothetical protein
MEALLFLARFSASSRPIKTGEKFGCQNGCQSVHCTFAAYPMNQFLELFEVGTVSLLLFDSTQYQFFCLSAFVAWGNA